MAEHGSQGSGNGHPEGAEEALESAQEALQQEQPEGAEEALEQEPPKLDPELEQRRREALANVRTFGDPALRIRAAEVTEFDQSLLDEVARMTGLMENALGVGLAATQLGVMHRVLVYRVGLDSPLVAVVNARLEWSSPEQEVFEEGCLSLPGVAVDVERPVHVRVTAKDERGAPIMIEASGLEARVLQHEMDHLDGVLILDRIDREQRKEAMRILREGPDGPAREPLEASPA